MIMYFVNAEKVSSVSITLSGRKVAGDALKNRDLEKPLRPLQHVQGAFHENGNRSELLLLLFIIAPVCSQPAFKAALDFCSSETNLSYNNTTKKEHYLEQSVCLR